MREGRRSEEGEEEKGGRRIGEEREGGGEGEWREMERKRKGGKIPPVFVLEFPWS